MSVTQKQPLRRAFATTEGVLVIVSDVLIGLGTIVPAHGLSPRIAAIVVGAQHVGLLVQQAIIKSKALASTTVVTKVLDQPNVGDAVKVVEDDVAALGALGIPTEVPATAATPDPGEPNVLPAGSV